MAILEKVVSILERTDDSINNLEKWKIGINSQLFQDVA